MVLSVMRMAVRQQKWAQIAQISEQQLTTYTFNKTGPNSRLKIVNSREIIVDGKLYDVVRKVENVSKITYHCVRDAKEQNLIAKTRLFNSEAQPMPVKNTARLMIEKIIKTAVIVNKSSTIQYNICQYYPVFDITTYLGPAISILHPPPQSCC